MREREHARRAGPAGQAGCSRSAALDITLTGVSDGRRRPPVGLPGMMLRFGSARVVLALVIVLATGCDLSLPPQPAPPTRVDRVTDAESAEAFVDAWLTDLTDSDSADRGIDFVHPSGRTTGVERQYARAVRELGSEPLVWEVLPMLDADHSHDVSFYSIAISIEGGSSRLPDDLLATRLVYPNLRDRDDQGIVVTVRVDSHGTGLARGG